MPLYDFYCPACAETTERIAKFDELDGLTCRTCKGPVQKLLSMGRYIPFKEGWYEHITDKPLYVSSMKQLRKECQKHGVYSIYAEDSR